MKNILPYVLRAMSLAAPERDHTELATAIADRVEAEAPLFKGDTDKERTVDIMLAVSFRESTHRNDAVGDHGQSFCAFQIHLPGGAKTSEGWTGDDLRSDANRCVAVAFRMLRQSIRIDADHPLAFYARGPRYRTEEARRLSRDRVALARRIRAATLAALAAESSS